MMFISAFAYLFGDAVISDYAPLGLPVIFRRFEQNCRKKKFNTSTWPCFASPLDIRIAEGCRPLTTIATNNSSSPPGPPEVALRNEGKGVRVGREEYDPPTFTP